MVLKKALCKGITLSEELRYLLHLWFWGLTTPKYCNFLKIYFFTLTKSNTAQLYNSLQVLLAMFKTKVCPCWFFLRRVSKSKCHIVSQWTTCYTVAVKLLELKSLLFSHDKYFFQLSKKFSHFLFCIDINGLFVRSL